MKKLVIALVATSALVSQASADVRSGFYVGADVSANALLAKGKTSYNESITTTGLNPFSSNHKSDLGRFGLGGGIYGGYGLLSGCMYYAGELAYNYDSAKAKHSHSHNFNSFAFPVVVPFTTQRASIKVKNEHAFNFAALIGTKLTANTVMYVRLGGNVSQVKMNATVFGQSLNKKKTRLSFAPGVGLETSMGRNWMARLEYSYDFGKGVSKSKSFDRTDLQVPTTQNFRASAKNVNTHSAKLGIAYKF